MNSGQYLILGYIVALTLLWGNAAYLWLQWRRQKALDRGGEAR